MAVVETYSIKLERPGGIHPEDIPVGRLAELLAVLSKQFAGKEEDFCLASMEDNCVRLDFRYASTTVKAAIIAFSALLAGQSIDINSSTFQNLSDFDRVRSKFPNVSITFPAIDNYPECTVPFERKFSEMVKKAPNLHFQHTVYGKVIDAGGDKPNIHIRPLGGGAEIICDCSEDLATTVAKQLYSIVGIVGEVTRSEPSIRMKAISLLPYRKPSKNPFSILKEKGFGTFFENESVEEFIHKVRGNDGESDD